MDYLFLNNKYVKTSDNFNLINTWNKFYSMFILSYSYKVSLAFIWNDSASYLANVCFSRFKIIMNTCWKLQVKRFSCQQIFNKNVKKIFFVIKYANCMVWHKDIFSVSTDWQTFSHFLIEFFFLHFLFLLTWTSIFFDGYFYLIFLRNTLHWSVIKWSFSVQDRKSR